MYKVETVNAGDWLGSHKLYCVYEEDSDKPVAWFVEKLAAQVYVAFLNAGKI